MSLLTAASASACEHAKASKEPSRKTGTIDLVDNDAALITSGPDGPYLLVVMTDGIGGAAGWQLIATISADVWQFEGQRPQYA